MSNGVHVKNDDIIIEKEVVVAIEGANFEHFIRSQVLGHADLENVQLINFMKDGLQLKSWLRVSRAIRGFDKIKAFGIIRDAEESASQMQQSIKSALKASEFEVPNSPKEIVIGTPNVSYLIIPDGEESGCLEHAILGAVTPTLPLGCVEDFLNCVEADYQQKNVQLREKAYALDNWRAKVKVNSLISCSEKPEISLGVSARRGMWDWNRPSLKVMIDFIQKLANSY